MDQPQKQKWFNSQIPLWGVLTFIVFPVASWLINLEFRVRTVESDAVVMKKTYESVSRMVWQVDGMAQGFSGLKEDVKSISTQQMDIWMLQREISDINCRTGGRCTDHPQRKSKP